jgi:guanosine-diphosphatase
VAANNSTDLVSIPLGTFNSSSRQRQNSAFSKSNQDDMMINSTIKTKKSLFWKCATAVTICILFLWLLYTPSTSYHNNISSNVKKGTFSKTGLKIFEQPTKNFYLSKIDVPSLNQQETEPTESSCSATKDGKPATEYAVMIDAGSSGSRVHVYKFTVCNDPVLEDEVFHMLEPGLSYYKDDSQAAAESLKKLMGIAVESVPKEFQSCTPIAVKATAGLRMLGQEQSKNILDAVRKYLENYPFPIATTGGVEIMEGKDEGLLGFYLFVLGLFH